MLITSTTIIPAMPVILISRLAAGLPAPMAAACRAVPAPSPLDPWLRRYGWLVVLALILMPFAMHWLLVVAGVIR